MGQLQNQAITNYVSKDVKDNKYSDVSRCSTPNQHQCTNKRKNPSQNGTTNKSIKSVLV